LTEGLSCKLVKLVKLCRCRCVVTCWIHTGTAPAGAERLPQIRELMVALESEVQEYGGLNKISCVQVDGKNAAAEFEDVQ